MVSLDGTIEPRELHLTSAEKKVEAGQNVVENIETTRSKMGTNLSRYVPSPAWGDESMMIRVSRN